MSPAMSGAAASESWLDEASDFFATSSITEELEHDSRSMHLLSLLPLLLMALGFVRQETSAIDKSNVTPSEHSVSVEAFFTTLF
jgi:hypothetical protein